MFSLSWKFDGTQLATVSRDNKVRIFEPRSKVSPMQVKNKICFFAILLIPLTAGDLERIGPKLRDNEHSTGYFFNVWSMLFRP